MSKREELSAIDKGVRSASTHVFAYIERFKTCDLNSMRLFINQELDRRAKSEAS